MLFVLKLPTQFQRSLEVFLDVSQGFLIKLLLLFSGVHDEFEDEVLALLGDLQVWTVEVDVPELIDANQGGLDDLVVILLETNQFAVLVEPKE